ncbi:hypothetical protein PR048_017567 [Dryococelus australis]|uniref:GH18 domain-containing protein n=1 Tax=Dryococelus australis TaxID=614101 RepID=A0ABQ9H9Y2_9NEOP|nr:hypothetical protein PR048_017567 [Dryococelus australis]
MQVRGKQREIPEKTRRQASSTSTILTCENPGTTRPVAIEPGTPWWEASRLTSQPPRSRGAVDNGKKGQGCAHVPGLGLGLTKGRINTGRCATRRGDSSSLPIGRPKRCGYRKFVALKEKNADLKVMVSIGGWAAGTTNFSAVVSDDDLRSRSAEHIASFALLHGFDGVDIDWEYPGKRDNASSTDKANFVIWLGLLRQELSKHDFLLSVAVGANRSFIESSYDVQQIAKNVDFITFMTYDFHSSSFENKTGYNAPLFQRPGDEDAFYNVDGCVSAWLDSGVPRTKLLLGMPLYGHSYELADESEAGVGAPTVGPGPANLSTSFSQICQMLKKEACDWSVIWDEYAMVPYATKGKSWISYEDRLSITEKALYAVEHNLGGASVWALDADDFAGNCFNIKYPLLTNILRVINYNKYLEYRRFSLYNTDTI